MKRRFAKAFFVIAAALVLLSAPVGATTTTSVTFDGVWWQELPANVRVFAVEGMLAGIEAGWGNGDVDGWYDAVHTFKVPYSQSAAAADKLTGEQFNNEPKLSKTFGIYSDEITLWYNLHPKRTSIKIGDLLLTCFVDKPSLLPPGMTCDDYASFLDK